MSGWRDFGHLQFLGNELGSWAVSLAIFLVALAVLPLLKRVVSARRRRGGGEHARYVVLKLLELLVEHTGWLFLWVVAIWLASQDLTFPARVEHWFNVALVLIFWVQAARWVMTAVRFAIDTRRVRSQGPDTLLKSSMQVVLFVAGLVIWGMAALLALDNLGIQIKPLLAGLGIGGIALALAVQTVLSDLLASVSIALDKPFGIGDALSVDDIQGTVEHIGVKSTRLRSVSGEQIILSNADILKSRVRNFGRLYERRSLFRLEVNYDTAVAALAAVPRAVREIIEATPETRFDRCHLLSLGNPALQFEVVYFVTNPDFKVYADAQQSINLRILERLRDLEVILQAAAPTQVRLQEPRGSAAAGAQQRLL